MNTMKAIAILGAFAASNASFALSQTSDTGANQVTVPPSTLSQRSPNRERIEILSDTQGVWLTPYSRRSIAAPIRRNWYQLMPDEAKAPARKQGQAVVEFSVARDGTGSDVKLAQTSGDDALDKAALDAVRMSSPFPALPADYKGQSLSLRMYFYYNPAPDGKFQGVGRMQDLRPRTGNPGTDGESQGPAGGQDQGARVGGEPYRARSGQTLPRIVSQVEPEFSEQARRDKVEGALSLRITVSATGDVTNAVVVKSLGSGLDEKALEAVRQWKFTPATKDGNPVSAEITVIVSFNLRH